VAEQRKQNELTKQRAKENIPDTMKKIFERIRTNNTERLAKAS